MSKDVKDTEAQEELKDKVNAGDVKEEKETKEKHAKAKKEDKDQKIEELGQKLSEINDKYLRLSAEFDNYRKRTLKERMELTKNAENKSGKNPACYDNFERALKSMETAEDVPALREGVELIYANFRDFLSQQGVKEMECLHTDFDPELQEAVTKIPAPAEELKGKVVDCIQKGYTLHDKVIRFPKVVVGE
ncbi:MAG: nucleotide exchange factor GrpE [Odoribacter splanchnicus]